MNKIAQLPVNKKLNVIYRVEPGCLGPEGKDHIFEFCRFAQQQLTTSDLNFVVINIIPRNDKALPEMQYSLIGKNMNENQANKYLTVLGKSLCEFEEPLCEKLTHLINEFMGYH